MHFSLHFFPMNVPAVTARKLANKCPTEPPTINARVEYFVARPIADIYDLSPISATIIVKKRTDILLV